MPGKVRVKILAGRNLPVMDRSSDTTDAYVEIKLASTTYKTDVYRKSLNPQWNSDFYRFELDDAELQDEPLQIRLMDHDTYSANDAIGKVNISLSPLLLPSLDTGGQMSVQPVGKGAVMSGWIPVFDTMHGIRGEVNLIVKVDLFSDVNKFRQSSCGVQFFHSANIPYGYHAQLIHGFVEELVVNDDPEYQWIDKIRTPRASNEARQTVFLRLSGQVQRKIGLKALDLGANAVIGYNQCFDLEGDVGVVARGIGTAVTLVKIVHEQIGQSAIADNVLVEESDNNSINANAGATTVVTSTQITAATASIAASMAASAPSLPPPVAAAIQQQQKGHIRAESAGDKLSHSPVKSASGGAAGSTSQATPIAGNGGAGTKEPVCRRSSDSDLNVTPKGCSLSTIDRPAAAAAATTAASGLLRVAGTTTLKTPLNQDNLDMLEYPFLTMSKYPVGFILHLGATVCARSVKLLERVPNPDEPETRDSWWTELRMEIRSHARSLGCNVVLGYCEVTTISDDVCVLSATGTAAVINLQFRTGEIGLLNAPVPAKIQSTSITQTQASMKDDGDVFYATKQTATTATAAAAATTTTATTSAKDSIGLAASKLDRVDADVPMAEVTTGIYANGISSGASGVGNTNTNGGIGSILNCTICHIPYCVTSVPYNVRMKKCAQCKQGRVPDVLLATIEIPENIQITGRGCFLQAQVCRTKKDLKSESNAKEISDGLPFLEYELHRLLINKLKMKGMNAIFRLKATVAIGEKMMALIATGTAVFLSALPEPSIPKIVAGNSWTNAEKLNELQKMLQDTYNRNREIYQLKPYEDLDESIQSTSHGDTDDDDDDESDDEQNEIDLTINNKDTCVIEVDDIEDLETISLLMESCPPDGFHVVNTQSVPGLHDLEVVRNLQMFTQVWRAKLSLNQQGSNFPRHFQRLLQTIFYKLRTMVPCAICDLNFKLDLPESEEIQILVTGMALGLGEPSKLTKYKRKIAATQQTKESKKMADDELIFSLEEEQQQLSDGGGGSGGGSGGTVNNNQQLIQTNSLKLKSKSPSRTRFNSVRLSRHLPLRERYGVDVTYLPYVPGGRIDRYLGNLNFFFIRECTSIRENGGISGFVHSFITEILAVVRAHITALGGNAMVSFYMTELILVDNPHKNQGQCLISVGGDVVFVSYFADD